MKYGSLVLELSDFVMIKKYQQLNHSYADYAHKNTLDILASNMSSAMILDPKQIPADIIQLNSTITVTCNGRWKETFKLVAPSKENIKRDKISVISTLGASVIGLSEGDIVRFGLPGNIMSLKIETVLHSNNKKEIVLSEEIMREFLPKNYKKNLSLNL